MDQNIINRYEINFKNEIDQLQGSRRKIDKFPYTNNKYLSIFLYSWNVIDINEILLPDINQALLTPNSEVENQSDTIFILIFNDKVDFYDENGLIYRLPTLDFKAIVIGWRDFLLTPPLNGTRV